MTVATTGTDASAHFGRVRDSAGSRCWAFARHRMKERSDSESEQTVVLNPISWKGEKEIAFSWVFTLILAGVVSYVLYAILSRLLQAH